MKLRLQTTRKGPLQPRTVPDPTGRFGPNLGQRVHEFLYALCRLLPDSRPVALFAGLEPAEEQDLLRVGQRPEAGRHGFDAGEQHELVCRWACVDGDFGNAPALMQQAALGMSSGSTWFNLQGVQLFTGPVVRKG